MQIEITEHKSQNVLRVNNTVRVFVDHDFSYGYWITETLMFSLFTEAQKEEYLKGDGIMDVSPEIAQSIIDQGSSIFPKQNVLKAA